MLVYAIIINEIFMRGLNRIWEVASNPRAFGSFQEFSSDMMRVTSIESGKEFVTYPFMSRDIYSLVLCTDWLEAKRM